MLELFPDSAALDGPRLALGGIDAAALAEEHGTPLVVLCEQTLRSTARALRDAVGDGRVFFGTKALPNVALLRLLREEGVGADVASAGELAFATAAGLDGGELVLHGNNKDTAFLAAAAALREAISPALSAAEIAGQERSVTAIRAELDGKTFAAAWAEGQAMPVETAVAYALAEEPA